MPLETARKAAVAIGWRGWIRGVIGAFVSGAAGAVGSFVGVETVLDVGIRETFLVMGVTALFSGITSLGKFLQTTPVPDDVAAKGDA